MQKEDIYIGINKSLKNNLKLGNFVPFETNITNISNLITEEILYKTGNNEYNCFLRKDQDKPLLILCRGFRQGKYSLRELINEEIILDNINAKYNFRIQPTNNTEEFEINSYGYRISFNYPKILDFTIKEEYTIYLLYQYESYREIDSYIKLAPDLERIRCDTSIDALVCKVKSDYFENKPNGYFNLYGYNYQKDYLTLLYEVPPLEVIIPKSKTINIKITEKNFIIGTNRIIYFPTNYNDNERNIFNVSDIEEKTKFEAMINTGSSTNILFCRLWKPYNDNIRIFCKIKRLTGDTFRFEKTVFYYNEYVINIILKDIFYIHQKNYEIPFLYSDKQTIDIKDDIESYNLKFIAEVYNNEILYLYGEVNNSLILDNCQKNEKELNCKVTKERLKEILVKSNEQFRVEALHEKEGLIKLINILNISILYEIDKKEDIYIGITGSLTDEISTGVSFGFKTNVTNIPNIYSDIIDNCYFKKYDDYPLLYLCKFDEAPKEPFKFGNLEDELIFNNMHYKYNFRIQPFEEIYNVSITGKQNNVNLILPEVLDFTSVDTLTITIVMSLNSYESGFWLNPSSMSYFICTNLNEMKKCNISVTHFINKESGNFYLYYSRSKRYYDLSPIKVLLPNSLLEINIETIDNKGFIYVGDKGLLYFKTNFNDNETNIFDAADIEEETNFIATLNFDYLVSYTDIKCRLWKPLNEKLWLFCKLNDSLRSEIDYIKIKDAVFHYKEHTISVFFVYNYLSNFQTKTLNVSVPFLYSDKQIINIKEEIDSYDLKFHIGVYNEQPLCLSIDDARKIILQDCKADEKDLICNIKKEKFFEILSNSNEQKLNLYPCDYSLNEINFNSVYDIIVNFDNIQKVDIFIGITKLLTNDVNINTFIAYETNITNISDIISDSFELIFGRYNQRFNCRIKKSNQTPLLIICLTSTSGSFYLEEIKQEKILDNINVKYNFRIQPVYLKEEFNVEEKGAYIKFAFPTVLNYYLNDTLNIDIDFDGNYYYKILNITLNPDLENNLICFNIKSTIHRCIIPKSHFYGKEDGYYPILFFNYLNNKTISYQLSPIQVILPKENDIVIRIKKEDNKDIIKIGQKGILYLMTDFKDENNIFKDEHISINSTIKDQNNYKCNVNCKLWLPKNEKLRIICKLNENLLYNNQSILLNKVEFTYSDYNIIITQQEPFEVKQLNYDISFLYSDKQNIEIKEGIESYSLNFYFEKYNDEILYIYGERNNSLILDNCEKNENELHCEIQKEKLEEILIINNEHFKIAGINDTIGITNFDTILDIVINYEINIKQDIYVGITELLFKSDSTPIVFKTNVTNFPSIKSDLFNLCYLKKINETPLLYFCNFELYTSSYKLDEEIIMNNSHYKYNFRIQPFNETFYFSIYNYETFIKIAYPQILNFTYEEFITIKYIMSNPSLTKKLYFISGSDYLECENINGLKKCTVPLKHFKGQKGGYYYLSTGSSFIHYESSPIKIILPDDKINPENIIVIHVIDNDKEQTIIGKNGFLSFTTNYTDEKDIFDISDIKEKTQFNTTISSYDNITCRLWKLKDNTIRLICKLHDTICSHCSISLDSSYFYYKKYKIEIISKASKIIVQTNENIPFLYSEKQEINIEEDKKFYELKFKIEDYNNEALFLQRKQPGMDMYLTELILDDCNVEENDLICKLEKEKIIESLYYNGEVFELNYYCSLTLLNKFSSVFDITINYNIAKKEDVFVGITKLLQNNLNVGDYIPYETNITSISNVNSNFFEYETNIDEYSCKIKKSTNKPLLFLCQNNQRIIVSSLGENNEEVILDNIHIKYNFRIQPVNNTEKFTMKNECSSILIRYPTKLDFTKNNTILINLFMLGEKKIKGIRLNPDSEELECQYYAEEIVKRCLVPKSHFNGKYSGYYYIFHLNNENKLNIFYEVSPILINLEDELIINIKKEDNKNIIKIGNKGIISLITDFNDTNDLFDSSDIEENTKFKAEFLGDKNYEANCRLWKPKNENIRMICKFNENLETNRIKLNRVNFEYKGKKFSIYSEDSIEVEQLNSNIAFLYSEKQEIIIEDDKQYCDLKFKIEEYSNEVLFLKRKNEGTDMYLTELIMDDCTVERKDLICKLEKEKIIESLYYNGEMFELYYYSSSEKIYKFSNVLDITINYIISKKEDVFVGITLLLQNNLNFFSYIPYETNITSISNLITDFFSFKTNIDEYSCRMKKSTSKPLLFLCLKANSEDTSSLGENNTEVILNDIHIKYNFRIQPVNRPEKFTMKKEGSRILIRYPTKLDFNENDLIPIYLIMTNPKNARGIRLNHYSEELDCEYPDDNLTKCIVPKSHFNLTSNGYYYIYYLSEENKLNIFYDISPIFVSFPMGDEIIINIKKEDNKNNIKIGNKGIISLITDFNDTNDLFDSSDIEENTKFKAEFLGDKNYEANCRLWKPKNENIRMICKFNENLKTNSIKLNRVISEYKGKKFYIYLEDNIMIEQLILNISFLYSDKQEINIENGKDFYDVIFKKDVYYNEPLILYKNKMKMINLDCKEKEKQIICNIKKDKLLEILGYNGEKFDLGQLTNFDGLQIFNSVLNISINYHNVTKKDIYLNLIKLVNQVTEKNNFIVYETNITDINKISTDYFNVYLERNNTLECILKSYDERLLLICKSLISGQSFLGAIKEINLTQVNILYNFIIENPKNNEIYTTSNKQGTSISLIYPEELDFNLTDSYILRYITDYPERIEGIQLNSNSSDKLNCANKNGFKECIIPESHFNDDGYYYTYYDNSFGTKSLAYEASKIKILLNHNKHNESDNTDETDESDEHAHSNNMKLIAIIVGSSVGGLVLIGLIVFFAVRYYKKKNATIDGFSGKNENKLLFSMEEGAPDN